jgi:hypothetical protein
MNTTATHEEWLTRLKAAVDAGFYRTEAAEGEQTRFPWQGKRCVDCVFWSGGRCRMHEETRSGMAHTCRSFCDAQSVAACLIHEMAPLTSGPPKAH